MKIAEYTIRKKVIALFMTFLVLGGGVFAYERLGRLEDPEFTIKMAKVITLYPGATPEEVEKEVTDILETEIQQLGQLLRITSQSMEGLSIITPEIKYEYTAAKLPQVWDELRRKVNDAQSKLPPGVIPSIVNDDFGDVYGVFFAVSGEGYSYRELKDYVDMLRREFLLVPGVAKVALWGTQQEQIFLEISRARIAQLGIPLDLIYNTIGQQNTITDAGAVAVGSEYISIQPSGEFNSVEAIGDVLIPDPTGQGRLIYVRDVAAISRGYQDPPTTVMRYNGEPAIGIGVSTVEGGNVVKMGELVQQRLKELESLTPLGIQLHAIAYQGKAVTVAIENFVVNLLEAVAIVIGVLMLFMGLRSGLIIGAILVITILATLIVMYALGITLQRISLGALIIALGMLVDNAIVITDGILVRISRGMESIEAANGIVGQTAMPLLGATVIAVLAFVPIGFSADSTGEYCRSLFTVMLISLLLSWVTAISITPLLCHLFLKPQPLPEGDDPGGSGFYKVYRGFLFFCIRVRYLTLLVTVGLLVLAVIGFGLLKPGFFPPSTQAQFMVNYWLPQGSDIRTTSADLKGIERFMLGLEGITGVSSFIGAGALRFQLTYTPEDTNPSYGQLIADVDDYGKIEGLAVKIYEYIKENYPDAQPVINKFELGPGSTFKIRARFSGPETTVLRALAEQAEQIMQEQGKPQVVTTDWREQVKLLVPQFSEAQARRTGIDRPHLALTLKAAFEGGAQVGLYREGNKLIPIVARPPADERRDVADINNVQIWSPVAHQAIPLRQVVSGFETRWDNGIIKRRNRMRTIEVRADAFPGELASVLLARVMPAIEAIPLPPGYKLEWGGEYEDSARAQGYIAAGIPVPALMMVVILVALFNNLRQPLVILLTVPLAIIGVTVGLLFVGEPFGFMAMLGFLSLSGMLIKSAIVLIDEINFQLHEGRDPLTAILNSGVSRLRPVAMAAATTVLGMIPLFTDPFFIGMAVTIVGGLSFATLLTLVVVPVLYATVYRVPGKPATPAEEKVGPSTPATAH